jgi:hypothetical protein
MRVGAIKGVLAMTDCGLQILDRFEVSSVLSV